MAETRTPVEVTTRHAATVDDLTGAWAFVMDRLDKVGPDPTIHIGPVWTLTPADDDKPRHFEVVVSGMQTEVPRG